MEEIKVISPEEISQDLIERGEVKAYSIINYLGFEVKMLELSPGAKIREHRHEKWTKQILFFPKTKRWRLYEIGELHKVVNATDEVMTVISITFKIPIAPMGQNSTPSLKEVSSNLLEKGKMKCYSILKFSNFEVSMFELSPEATIRKPECGMWEKQVLFFSDTKEWRDCEVTQAYKITNMTNEKMIVIAVKFKIPIAP